MQLQSNEPEEQFSVIWLKFSGCYCCFLLKFCEADMSKYRAAKKAS